MDNSVPRGNVANNNILNMRESGHRIRCFQ